MARAARSRSTRRIQSSAPTTLEIQPLPPRTASEKRRCMRLARVEAAVHNDEIPMTFCAALHVNPERSRAAYNKYFGHPTQQMQLTPASRPRSTIPASIRSQRSAITPKGRSEKKAQKVPFTPSRNYDGHDELDEPMSGATPSMHRMMTTGSSQTVGSQLGTATPRTVRRMLMTPSQRYNTADAMEEDELASPEKDVPTTRNMSRSPSKRTGYIRYPAVRTMSPSISRTFTMGNDENDDELATMEVQTYKIKIPRKKAAQSMKETENPARILRHALEAASQQRGRPPMRQFDTSVMEIPKMNQDEDTEMQDLDNRRDESAVFKRQDRSVEQVEEYPASSLFLGNSRLPGRQRTLSHLPSDPETSVPSLESATTPQPIPVPKLPDEDHEMGEAFEEDPGDVTIMPIPKAVTEEPKSPSRQLVLKATPYDDRIPTSPRRPTPLLPPVPTTLPSSPPLRFKASYIAGSSLLQSLLSDLPPPTPYVESQPHTVPETEGAGNIEIMNVQEEVRALSQVDILKRVEMEEQISSLSAGERTLDVLPHAIIPQESQNTVVEDVGFVVDSTAPITQVPVQELEESTQEAPHQPSSAEEMATQSQDKTDIVLQASEASKFTKTTLRTDAVVLEQEMETESESEHEDFTNSAEHHPEKLAISEIFETVAELENQNAPEQDQVPVDNMVPAHSMSIEAPVLVLESVIIGQPSSATNSMDRKGPSDVDSFVSKVEVETRTTTEPSSTTDERPVVESFASMASPQSSTQSEAKKLRDDEAKEVTSDIREQLLEITMSPPEALSRQEDITLEAKPEHDESIVTDESTMLNTQLEEAMRNVPLDKISYTQVYRDRVLTQDDVLDRPQILLAISASGEIPPGLSQSFSQLDMSDGSEDIPTNPAEPTTVDRCEETPEVESMEAEVEPVAEVVDIAESTDIQHIPVAPVEKDATELTQYKTSTPVLSQVEHVSKPNLPAKTALEAPKLHSQNESGGEPDRLEDFSQLTKDTESTEKVTSDYAIHNETKSHPLENGPINVAIVDQAPPETDYSMMEVEEVHEELIQIRRVPDIIPFLDVQFEVEVISEATNRPVTPPAEETTLPPLHDHFSEAMVVPADISHNSEGSTKIIPMTPAVNAPRTMATPPRASQQYDNFWGDSDVIISSPLAELAMSFPVDLHGNPLKRKRWASSESSTPYGNPSQRALDAYDDRTIDPENLHIDSPTKIDKLSRLTTRTPNALKFWSSQIPPSRLALPQYEVANAATQIIERTPLATPKAAWTSEMAIRSSPRYSPLPRHLSKRTRHRSPWNSPVIIGDSQSHVPLIEAALASQSLAVAMKIDNKADDADESVIEDTILPEQNEKPGEPREQDVDDDSDDALSSIHSETIIEDTILPEQHEQSPPVHERSFEVSASPVTHMSLGRTDDVILRPVSSSSLSSASSIELSLNNDVVYAPSSVPEVSRTPRYPRYSQTANSYIEPDTDSEFEVEGDAETDEEKQLLRIFTYESDSELSDVELDSGAEAEVEVLEIDLNEHIHSDNDTSSDDLSDAESPEESSKLDVAAEHLKQRTLRLARLPTLTVKPNRSSLSTQNIADFSFDEHLPSTEAVLVPLRGAVIQRPAPSISPDKHPLITPIPKVKRVKQRVNKIPVTPSKPQTRTPSPPPMATMIKKPQHDIFYDDLSPGSIQKKQQLVAGDSENIYELPESPHKISAQAILKRARLSRSANRSRIRQRRSYIELMAHSQQVLYSDTYATSPLTSRFDSAFTDATAILNPPETPTAMAQTRITSNSAVGTVNTHVSPLAAAHSALDVAIDDAIVNAPSPWMDEPSSINFGPANSQDKGPLGIPRFPGPSQLPIDDSTPSALEKNPWASTTLRTHIYTAQFAEITDQMDTTGSMWDYKVAPHSVDAPVAAIRSADPSTSLSKSTRQTHNSRPLRDQLNYRSLRTPSQNASSHASKRHRILDLLPSSTKSTKLQATPSNDDFVVRSFASFMLSSNGRSSSVSGHRAGVSPCRTGVSGGILKLRTPSQGYAQARRARKRVRWEPSLGSTAIVTVKTGMERPRQASPPPENPLSTSSNRELLDEDDCESKLAARHLDAMKKREAMVAANEKVGNKRLLPSESQQLQASQPMDAMALAFLVAENDMVPGSQADTESYPEVFQESVEKEKSAANTIFDDSTGKYTGESSKPAPTATSTTSGMSVVAELLGGEDTEMMDLGQDDDDNDDVGYVINNLEDFLGIPLTVDDEIKKQAHLATQG